MLYPDLCRNTVINYINVFTGLLFSILYIHIYIYNFHPKCMLHIIVIINIKNFKK